MARHGVAYVFSVEFFINPSGIASYSSGFAKQHWDTRRGTDFNTEGVAVCPSSTYRVLKDAGPLGPVKQDGSKKSHRDLRSRPDFPQT